MIESLLLCRGDCRRSSSPLFMLYLLLLINWVFDFDRWKFDRLNVLFLFFSISQMSWSPQKSQETFRIQSSKDWPFVIIVYEALLQAILVQMCFVCFRCLFAFAVQRWLMRMWGHEKLNIAWPKAVKLGTLRVAAAGQVSHCLFCHVHTLLEDAAQTLCAVHAGLCSGGDGAIKERTERGSIRAWPRDVFLFHSPAGTQWKPTLTEVVLTGAQPGWQRSTGSTE